MHRLIKIAAFTGIAFFAAATAANASVNIDSAGKGFVGKGDVQVALGFNNAVLQKAVDAKSLVFTAQQPTAQSLTQSVEQAGSQAGTQVGTQSGSQAGSQSGSQSMSQDLTCEFTNGNGTKTFHREGERDGSRSGVREGERTGTREGVRDVSRDGNRIGVQTGVQTGSIAYDLDVEARKHSQYTGFILKGWKGTPAYSETGVPTWNAPEFAAWEFGADWTFTDWNFAGDYTFGDYTFGDYTFGDAVTWGEWDALPGENPDDCLRSQNADKITQISNVIIPGAVTHGVIVNGAVTYGAVVEGDVTEGAIIEDAIAYGPITPGVVGANGSAKVFVNGKALSSVRLMPTNTSGPPDPYGSGAAPAFCPPHDGYSPSCRQQLTTCVDRCDCCIGPEAALILRVLFHHSGVVTR